MLIIRSLARLTGKTLLVAGLGGLLLSQAALVATAQDKKPDLANEKNKRSYAIGMEIGNNLRTAKFDVDQNVFFQAFQDAYAGKQMALTEEEKKEVIAAMQREAMQKRQEEMKTMSEKNLKEGQAFLDENKKKPGVVTTPSGLQYKVVAEGKGAKPKPEDTVTVHYKGTLIDGTEFDSSFKRNAPATFPANRVIPGWTEVLQLMSPGAKFQVYIPSNLAYGPQSPSPVIGPNSTLIFDIELISIDSPKDEPAPAGQSKPGAKPEAKSDAKTDAKAKPEAKKQ